MAALERGVHAAYAFERFETWGMPKNSDRPGVKRPEGRAPPVSAAAIRMESHSSHHNRLSLSANFRESALTSDDGPVEKVRRALVRPPLRSYSEYAPFELCFIPLAARHDHCPFLGRRDSEANACIPL